MQSLHVLWWDIETSHHSESHPADAWSQFNITAFDTLTGLNVTNASLKQPPLKVVQDYIDKVSSLDMWIRKKMKDL